MIKQYGKVTIAKDFISITKFWFDTSKEAREVSLTSCEVEALKWAQERIESALRQHKIMFTPKRTIIITD